MHTDKRQQVFSAEVRDTLHKSEMPSLQSSKYRSIAAELKGGEEGGGGGGGGRKEVFFKMRIKILFLYSQDVVQ